MKDEKVYLGIDIGGTKINIGIVDENGHLLVTDRYPTRWGTYASFQKDITAYLDDFLNRHDGFVLQGAGIGFRAIVNYIEQVVAFSRIVKDTVNFDICKVVSGLLDCPVKLDNDVNAMAIGEYLYGAGRGRDSFVYINIGTGLGCGIVSDGRMFRGRRGNAGELTQYYIRKEEGYINLENCISGEEFSRQAQKLWRGKKNPEEPVGALLQAWEGGDQGACAIVEKGVRELALGMINMEAVLDSGLYVFGGKVVSNKRLMERIQEEVFSIAKEAGSFIDMEICTSALGVENSGVIGAAALAKYELAEGRNG